LSTLAPQRSPRTSIAALRAETALVLGSLLVLGAGAIATHKAHAQSRDTTVGIYTCTDARGVRRTSDRPIVECIDREQRVLNADGSVKRIVPPTLTAEERAEREAAERKLAEERAALNDAVRRDRNLKARFPTEQVHQRAREAALEVVRVALRTSKDRIKELEGERKPLIAEAEFYRGRALPARLKQQMEANETSVAALRDLIQTQEAELLRINRIYDAELDHLRKLWNGARPGSISLVSAPAAPAETR
jgi:hypothetical protein